MKKFEKVLICGVAGALLISALAGCSSKKDTSGNVEVYAQVDESGKAVIETLDAGVIEIPDENVKEAVISPDRETVAVLLEDGVLYLSNKKFKEKEELSTKCDSIFAMRNEGIIFDENDGNRIVHGKVTMGLNTLDGILVADNSLATVYARLGDIQLISSDGYSMKTIGEYDKDNETVEFTKISDDGEYAQWIVSTGNTIKTFVYENGEVVSKNEYSLQEVAPGVVDFR